MYSTPDDGPDMIPTMKDASASSVLVPRAELGLPDPLPDVLQGEVVEGLGEFVVDGRVPHEGCADGGANVWVRVDGMFPSAPVSRVRIKRAKLGICVNAARCTFRLRLMPPPEGSPPLVTAVPPPPPPPPRLPPRPPLESNASSMSLLSTHSDGSDGGGGGGGGAGGATGGSGDGGIGGGKEEEATQPENETAPRALTLVMEGGAPVVHVEGTRCRIREPEDHCIMCYQRRPNVVLIPCGHVCMCDDPCAYAYRAWSIDRGIMATCPLCRSVGAGWATLSEQVMRFVSRRAAGKD